MYQLYAVGGSVRDKLMNRAPIDIDILVVFDNHMPVSIVFDLLKEHLRSKRFVVYLEKQDRWTIRCKFPKNHPEFPGQPVDFQLAVKNDQVCNLTENLLMRDFTINALAMNIETREIVDIVNGQDHLKLRELHCVNRDIFVSDPVRVIRAFRLSMSHQLKIGYDIISGINDLSIDDFRKIDSGRLMREVQKMFKYDTRLALVRFGDLYKWNFPIWNCIFETLRLNPIMNKYESL